MAATKRYPRPQEVFELTLDGSHPNFRSPALVESFGYCKTGWKHEWGEISGILTRKLKLVPTGLCPNLEALQKSLEVYGPSPSGLWINSFREIYAKPDEYIRVGVLDLSWTNPSGEDCFPCIFSSGEPGFLTKKRVFKRYWRWLVFAE